MHSGRALRESFTRFGVWVRIAMGGATLVLALGPASSQPIDCGELAARITALGEGSQTHSNHYGGGAQKQRADLDRTIRYARTLGCDRSRFFCSTRRRRNARALTRKFNKCRRTLPNTKEAGIPPAMQRRGSN